MNHSANRHLITPRRLLAGLALVALLALGVLAHGLRDARALDRPATSTNRAHTTTDGNWNFERGNLDGWHARSRGSGAWYVYTDGTKPPNPAETDPHVAFDMPAPPEGRHAAVTDMTAPGSRILYRDIKLDRAVKLTLTVFYANAGAFASPRSLDFNGCEANQQFRVDIIDPSAPANTMAARHVLTTLFATAPGDPATLAPRTASADLSEWTSQRVRLRVAQVDNRGPLRAAIDDVRLEPIK
jgi:hypothetical protein